ncbi:hypothetical protein SAMN06296020_10588 [Anoxynatronum buryatiense]|uniref:Uncharacterized protein n=1 Tax=Anoxynatronum buryatiense TaxID=489973 RepID=A0AA45WVN1_9CLOT|nr:hypothetical protein SAMN06296020_10588 [Anoxynatronum buryatiense]
MRFMFSMLRMFRVGCVAGTIRQFGQQMMVCDGLRMMVLLAAMPLPDALFTDALLSDKPNGQGIAVIFIVGGFHGGNNGADEVQQPKNNES